MRRLLIVVAMLVAVAGVSSVNKAEAQLVIYCTYFSADDKLAPNVFFVTSRTQCETMPLQGPNVAVWLEGIQYGANDWHLIDPSGLPAAVQFGPNALQPPAAIIQRQYTVNPYFGLVCRRAKALHAAAAANVALAWSITGGECY